MCACVILRVRDEIYFIITIKFSLQDSHSADKHLMDDMMNVNVQTVSVTNKAAADQTRYGTQQIRFFLTK